MEIITSTTDLVIGDVLYISKLVEPRGREEFWWRAYWIVESRPRRGLVEMMLLKMNPDPDKDHRMFDFTECGDKQVIQYLRPEDYPQGVQAMRIKHIAQGRIKLEGS